MLGGAEPKLAGDDLSVLIVGDAEHTYGLVVDRFLGERELVVQPLVARLGKIKDIAAGALMEDGSPVLIVDTEDLNRSMERLVRDGRLARIDKAETPSEHKRRKRVLVVDDSLTVRELERKLLGSHGYDVEVAATFLQSHPNTTFYVDRAAAAELTRIKTPWLLDEVHWTPELTVRAVVWLSEIL